MLPLRFPNAPGSASGCSFIDVWRWSGVWRHVLREYIGLQGKFLRQFLRTCPDRRRQGRFTRDGERSGGVFHQKFKLDYGNTHCSLKPYKIKGKTVTPNAVDSAGVACLL